MAITRPLFPAGVSTAFGAISGAFAVVLAATPEVAMLFLANATDASIEVSLDGGTTYHLTLAPASNIMFNFMQNGIEATVAVAIRHTGVAPTVRQFAVTAVRRRK